MNAFDCPTCDWQGPLLPGEGDWLRFHVAWHELVRALFAPVRDVLSRLFGADAE